MTQFSVAVLAGLTLIAAGLPASAATTNVYYRFNTGPNAAAVTSAIDSSTNALNGSITGPLTYSNDVLAGGGKFSLNATGDFDYVTVLDAAPLRPAGSFTLSAWVKPTGGTPNPPGDAIIVKKTGVEAGACITSYFLGYDGQAQRFFALICSTSNPNDTGTSIATKDTFPPGTWHKVAMKYTINNTTHKGAFSLVVDGVVEAKVALKSFPGIYYTGGPFIIGAANFLGDDHSFFRRNFLGYIDEVKLVTP